MWLVIMIAASAIVFGLYVRYFVHLIQARRKYEYPETKASFILMCFMITVFIPLQVGCLALGESPIISAIVTLIAIILLVISYITILSFPVVIQKSTDQKEQI